MNYSVPSDIINLRQHEFYQRLKFELGDQIYLVGGAVRDMLLDKPVKDYDLLVTGMPLNDLELILGQYGKVDLVGKSFGVLKFRPSTQPDMEFDVAVPRMETKTGKGHHGFDVVLDHVTLEQDLFRRDFTFNAMALALDSLLIVDPFNGYEDLHQHLIRVVNPNAFNEDPLRMLRAVQFGARFGFTMEDKTLGLIRGNAEAIAQISGERILTELDKIVSKGNVYTGAHLLDITGLYKSIFKIGRMRPFDAKWCGMISTTPEFLYVLNYHVLDFLNMEDFWGNRLKGDLDGAREIAALAIANDVKGWAKLGDSRYAFHRAFMKSPRILKTDILCNEALAIQTEFNTGSLPKSLKDLTINGEDLMGLGYQGVDIGNALKGALLGIYREEVHNEKPELLAFVMEKYPPNENPASNLVSSIPS